jgi:F-box-like
MQSCPSPQRFLVHSYTFIMESQIYQTSGLPHQNGLPTTSIDPPVSVYLLPTDVLLMIFRLVYNDAQSKSDFDPCAFASVCTAWRDVMSLVPEFWTHIIIQIDSGLFSLGDVWCHLNWSRNLLIDVHITHKTDLFKTRELEENTRVESITALLSPHVHRCRKIRYDVIHSSSHPLVSPDIYHTTPRLSELCLKSSAQGSGSPSAGVLRALPSAVHTELCFPSLSKLTLDGWNFVNLCHSNPQWAQQADHYHTLSVTIAHFRPSESAGGRFSLHNCFQFLSRIRHLVSLKLHDVEFDFELVTRMDNLPTNFLPLQYVMLSHLSSRLTAGILSYLGMDMKVLKIRCCPLDEVGNRTPPGYYALVLDNVPITQDIFQFLSSWQGASLQISDCPAFNEMLEMLGPRSNERGVEICAPRLRYLSLDNCTNFTTPALKRMVEGRQKNALFDFNKLSDITIERRGHVPEISDEDELWFWENLNRFDVLER